MKAGPFWGVLLAFIAASGLRGYSKPVVEEISRRLNYTPHGSRTEILDRLLSNLEGIKVGQYKMDQILTGT